jgi:hypothetical protein
VQTNQRPMYWKTPLHCLIIIKFFVWEWPYVKQKKDNNKKIQREGKFCVELSAYYFSIK